MSASAPISTLKSWTKPSPPRQRARAFLEDPKTEILEHRNRFRKGDQPAAAIGLEPQLIGRVLVIARNAHVAVGVAGKPAQADDVRRAFAGRGARTVAVGERAEIGNGKAGRERRPGRLDQLGLDRRAPPADHLDHGFVKLAGVGQRRLLVDILGVADQREVAVAELDRPAGDLAPDLGFEKLARWPCGAGSSAPRAAARRS